MKLNNHIVPLTLLKSEYTFVDMYVSAHATGSRLFTHQNQMVVASTAQVTEGQFSCWYTDIHTLFADQPSLQWSQKIYEVAFTFLSKCNFREMLSGFQLFSRLVSRSAHQTPNFTNPKFQFPQFKVLQIVFSL